MRNEIRKNQNEKKTALDRNASYEGFIIYIDGGGGTVAGTGSSGNK